MKSDKLIVCMGLTMLAAYLWLIRSMERQNRYATQDIINEYTDKLNAMMHEFREGPYNATYPVEDVKPRDDAMTVTDKVYDSPFTIQGLNDENPE